LHHIGRRRHASGCASGAAVVARERSIAWSAHASLVALTALPRRSSSTRSPKRRTSFGWGAKSLAAPVTSSSASRRRSARSTPPDPARVPPGPCRSPTTRHFRRTCPDVTKRRPRRSTACSCVRAAHLLAHLQASRRRPGEPSMPAQLLRSVLRGPTQPTNAVPSAARSFASARICAMRTVPARLCTIAATCCESSPSSSRSSTISRSSGESR
jgi:hypothetical protein